MKFYLLIMNMVRSIEHGILYVKKQEQNIETSSILKDMTNQIEEYEKNVSSLGILHIVCTLTEPMVT